MSHVWDSSKQKGSALLLMLALADFSDDSGFSWPSLSTLASKTRLKVRQTHNIVDKLIASGELFVNKRHGKSSQYLILLGCEREIFTHILTQKMGFSLEETADFEANIFAPTPALHCTPAKFAPLQPSAKTPAMGCRSPLHPIAYDPSITIITSNEGLNSLWSDIQAELKNAFASQIYQLHLQRTTAVAFDNDVLTIQPGVTRSVGWINGSLNETLRRVASGVVGREIGVKGVMASD